MSVVVKKHKLDPIDNFDPWPPEFCGKLQSRLHLFLDKVRGEGLGTSYLFDPSTPVWSESTCTSPESTVELPSKDNVMHRVSIFIESFSVSEKKAQQIERSTREQHKSSLWFDA